MKEQIRSRVLHLFAATLGVILPLSLGARSLPVTPTFNTPGNILIADQFNNRVLEADASGRIVWQFGLGPNDFSIRSVPGVNDAERVGVNTLIAGTGIPAGVNPQVPDGVVDNRVMLVDQAKHIIWQYGVFGQTGAGLNRLNTPVQATWLPTSHVLITDQGNNRVIEVDLNRRIVWQYPGVNTPEFDQLNSPNSAQLLSNGHILIADEGNNRAIEVTRTRLIVRTYTAGGTVRGVAFASQLPNGHILLTDSGNSRIVEVDRLDNVFWEYFTDTETLSFGAPSPSRAVRLFNGDTLISDQLNNRVIRVTRAGRIVARYGLPLDGGNNIGYNLISTQRGLNAPYDAKIIGDYTGLTRPTSP